MRKIKHIAIAGICCLAAAAGGVLAQKDVTSVSATGTLTDLNTTENHFYMDPGAYVRVATNSSGIRFSTCVSSEWYALATKDGATVEFHTVIDKYDNDDTGEEVDLTATYLAYDAVNDVYKFTGDIVYNELTEEEQVQAYNMQLVASSYAVIKKDGEEDVRIESLSDGVVRSMAEAADIAMKAEAANGYANSDEGSFTTTVEDVLNGYRIIEVTTAYIDGTDGTLDMPEGFEDATILKVTMADENDAYDTENGTFTFDDDVSATTAAVDAYATVYTDKGILETNFKVCTKVIKSATDWMDTLDVAAKTTGYYYLANDITGYPTLTMDTRATTAGNAFAGVFDGGGHTATFSLTTHNGLFVSLGNATIKNVRFDIRITTGNSRNVGLAFVDNGNTHYADMYLNIESLGASCTNFGSIAYRLLSFSQFTRVVVETPTADELADYTQTSMGALFRDIEKIDTGTGKTTVAQDSKFNTDVYVISHLPLARVAGYASPVNWTIYAQNQMPDTDEDGAKTEDDIDTTNKITYWPTKVSATPKGKVYSYASFADLKTAATAPNETTAAEIDLKPYTDTLYWQLDETTGYLVWKGAN